jgi:DsbC/DsbD-like thiol-disulfide interchange protein
LSINPRRILGSAAFTALTLAGWVPGAARPAAAAASAWASNPQSQVRLISGWRVAPRNGELRLGVQFRLAPGWHAYWKNSGDAGFAPMVTFAPLPGLERPELLWPAPHRFAMAGGLEAFGYQDEVVYPVRAPLDAGPSSGGLHLVASVDYVVCQVDCVPHRYDLTLDQAVGNRAEVDPQTAPLLDRWWRRLPLAAGARLPAADGTTPADGTTAADGTTPADGMTGTAGKEIPPAVARMEIVDARQTARTAASRAATPPPADLRLELRLPGVDAAPEGADLFFESHPAFELGRPRVAAAPGGLLFDVPVRRKDTSAQLPASTELAWTATGLRRHGSSATLALAARQRVGIGPSFGAGAADRGVRGTLAAADPRVLALAAAVAALLTLEGWGLLRRRREAAVPPGSSQPSLRSPRSPSPLRREALGFLALLATFALLYALSLEISPEGMAGVELVLLAMGLLAWLRRRIERPGPARLLLAAALAACIAAAPWLADRQRLF